MKKIYDVPLWEDVQQHHYVQLELAATLNAEVEVYDTYNGVNDFNNYDFFLQQIK